LIVRCGFLKVGVCHARTVASLQAAVDTTQPCFSKKREAARPNATQRGYTSRGWQLTRQEVLQRDMHQCQLCGKIVTGKDAHVDHIVRKKITGCDHVSGLQTLCASCHSRKTCQETAATPHA